MSTMITQNASTAGVRAECPNTAIYEGGAAGRTTGRAIPRCADVYIVPRSDGVRRVLRPGAMCAVARRLLRAEPDDPETEEQLSPRRVPSIPSTSSHRSRRASQEVKLAAAGDLQPAPVGIWGALARRARATMMGKIAVGIVGVGNCASSLLQGIEFYRGGGPRDRQRTSGSCTSTCAATGRATSRSSAPSTSTSARSASRSTSRRWRRPNNTRPLYPKLPRSSVVVEMGPVLDGVAEHMRDYPPEQRVRRRRAAAGRRRRGAQAERRRDPRQLPAGRQPAGDRALRAGLPRRRASRSSTASRSSSCPIRSGRAEFERRGIPVVGDDIKSQVGATIVHRMLAKLFDDRGVVLDRTYQLNTGGNTDFLNMLNRARTGVEAALARPRRCRASCREPLPTDDDPHRPERLRPLAARQQGLLPPHGGPRLRQRADRARAAPVGARTAPTPPAASSTPSAAAAWRATRRSAARCSASRRT